MIFLYLEGEDWVVTREGNTDRRTTGFKASEPVERVLAAVREAAPRIPVLVGRPPGPSA